MMKRNSLVKISKLAFSDFCYEWQMSLCFVLAIAAVLGPVMVLFGLKYGVVGSMITTLIEEPRNREIRPVSSGRYDRAWFSNLSQKPEVHFLLPRTRNIAATMQLKSKTARRIIEVELIPTAKYDPLLPGVINPPDNYATLILSSTAARKLAVEPGDMINGSIARRYRGQQERVHLPLKVQAIAGGNAFNRDGAFVSLALLEAVEGYLDGHTVPVLGWSGDAAGNKDFYPGFRLFARSIDDVVKLKNWFIEQGISVKTRAAEIETVQRLDQNLTTIYWSIAFIGMVGCALALGANLWSNVERKRKQLSVLRLVGFGTIDIVWFPMIQSLISAFLGWGLAVVIYNLTSLGINHMMLDQLDRGQEVCTLLIKHFAGALAITCLVALLAAFVAGLRAAYIEPAEGLREQ